MGWLRPQSFMSMEILSRPITPTPRKRNPPRIHLMRWYLSRRGKSGRCARSSYREDKLT